MSKTSHDANKLDVVVFSAVGIPATGTVHRRDLMLNLDLSLRDMRLMDGTAINRHPVIMPRKSAIVVSLDQTCRCVIERDRVTMVDPGTLSGERLAVLIEHALAGRNDMIG